MDNVKMPFLPEDTLKTQRVEIYLNDLKERLQELRVQHDEVIQHSVDIIKEIDDVSTGLLLPHNSSSISSNDNVTKIKKLIQEFETARESNAISKASIPLDSKVDIRKILQNFEKLNESHVLKESLVLFKRAKESLEKIDTFFGTHLENVITQSVVNAGTKAITEPLFNATVTATITEATNMNKLISPKSSSVTINNITTNNNNTVDCSTKMTNNDAVPCCTSPPKLDAAGSQISNNSNSSLKERINMFNSAKMQPTIQCNTHKAKDLTSSCYASCCSSVTSMDVYQSTENVCLQNLYDSEMGTVNSLEIGYEGDNDDSEYDLLALKRKKNKIPSTANQ